MKIGIDIRELSILGTKAGWYQYTFNLVTNLLASDSENEFVLLSTLRGFDGGEQIGRKSLRKFSGRLSALLLNKLSLPLEFVVGEVDVFHGPCYFLPGSLRSRKVVTIHDLLSLTYPEYLQPWDVAHMKQIIDVAVKRADLIVTVSNFSKSEIRDILKVPEDRIRVVYNGAASTYRPLRDVEALEVVKAKYEIRGNYILFVGNLEPKKNIITLLEAWRHLRSEADCPKSLVIVGNKDFYFDSVWRACKRHRIENEVVFTGVVPDADLPFLFGGAEMFVFPSLFEGFGIPVIEAMACGTPVVASDRTSIPEIAGDAALLVDPLSAEDMCGAMHRILSDSSLKETLVEKGLERAKSFSWERTASETLKVYLELA